MMTQIIPEGTLVEYTEYIEGGVNFSLGRIVKCLRGANSGINGYEIQVLNGEEARRRTSDVRVAKIETDLTMLCTL